jgi:hypothetical protein
MPPVTEQQNPIPPPAVIRPNTSKTIKFIRIFLLALIIIGLGLIATEKLWVPKLVDILVPTTSVSISQIYPNTSSSDISTSTTNVSGVQWMSLAQANGLGFATLSGNVGYEARVISAADPKTFEVSTYAQGTSTVFACYAKDKNNVYYNCDPRNFFSIIKNAYPESFQVLNIKLSDGNFIYSKDSGHVYYDGFPLPNIDSASVSVVPDDSSLNYIKDKNDVYLVGEDPVTGVGATDLSADPNTFKLLGSDGWGYYAEDKNRVYFWVLPISGADLSTFAVVPSSTYQSTYDAQDKNHKYLQGRVVQ